MCSNSIQSVRFSMHSREGVRAVFVAFSRRLARLEGLRCREVLCEVFVKCSTTPIEKSGRPAFGLTTFRGSKTATGLDR